MVFLVGLGRGEGEGVTELGFQDWIEFQAVVGKRVFEASLRSSLV